MENRYSSRDFLIIIQDASKLAQLVYYSLRYLHFSDATWQLNVQKQCLSFYSILRIFLKSVMRKIRKMTNLKFWWALGKCKYLRLLYTFRNEMKTRGLSLLASRMIIEKFWLEYLFSITLTWTMCVRLSVFRRAVSVLFFSIFSVVFHKNQKSLLNSC